MSEQQQRAWPVIGHEWAVRLLQNGLEAQRLPHALLITGPPQVGKMTLAQALASALNCQGDSPPCGECRSCRIISHGTHPDVRAVEAETSKKGREGILKIEQIRQIQRDAALAPMEGRFKIFLLRELERANLPAANALLKTLEEPPSKVILLLTSARPQALLPTVVSRCQVVPLRPLPVGQVSQALQHRWHADQTQADLLARLSGGRLGWAVERLTDKQAWEERAQRLAEAQALPEKSRLERLAYASSLSRNPGAVLPTLGIWSSWWRDLLLVQQGCGQYISNIDLTSQLRAEAERFRPQQVRQFLSRLQAGPTLMSQNVNARLLLENLMLHLPRPLS